MYPVRRAPTDRSDAGFTILEVLVALAVVAVSLVAIGSVMSTNVRGVKALENHVAMMQSAQTVLATAIPPRKELVPGVLSGQVGDFRWRIDIGPVGGNWLAKDTDAAWIPELVRVQVRSPSGATVDLETVRLMRGSRQ
ncbi:MAG TPA: prepilin-type N-terminal cleavage/methylation domain-containing protein [Bradyrhizobium sp.]|nr:prepilin-type N-terminal cleavage/methylation domain-containing protein [Bradyrhizobium sp.]